MRLLEWDDHELRLQQLDAERWRAPEINQGTVADGDQDDASENDARASVRECNKHRYAE